MLLIAFKLEAFEKGVNLTLGLLLSALLLIMEEPLILLGKM